MAKKKKLGLADLGGFVFSTNDDFKLNTDTPEETLDPKDQYLEAHFSNKGRGGKTVTIIKGYEGTADNLKELAKVLKKKCGVGGAIKDYEIIIQGNYRNKIMKILTNEGYNVKRIGG